MKAPGSRTFGILASAVAFVFLSSFAPQSFAVPSYARQTGMACEACHTVFPELTPFGRAFKINGYLVDNLPQVQGITTNNDQALLLNQLPPLSIMFQASDTHTNKSVPDSAIAGRNAQNSTAQFPQQVSLFYAGRIAPNVGGFLQFTYSGSSGTFGWDNTDIRYANQVAAVADGLTYGFTLNNNPTVQDAWNSTPAWQTPFDQKSAVAPTPTASTLIDGQLATNVVGATAYAWFMNSVYGEFGLYRSAVQGLGHPLDSLSPVRTINGYAPYWRFAYERQWDRNSLSVGTYGLLAELRPAGLVVGGPTDRYRDIALDTQYQFIGDNHLFSLQATYIKENQTLDASVADGLAANNANDLKTLRVGGSYYYQRKYGGSLGYFSTTGSVDALKYPSAPVAGSFSNSPDSRGWIGEVDYVPWQNMKILLQYIAYNKFNGGSSNYDGFGRNASDNNTLYLLAWFAF